MAPGDQALLQVHLRMSKGPASQQMEGTVLSVMTTIKWVVRGETAELKYFGSASPQRKLVKDILTSVLSGVNHEHKISVQVGRRVCVLPCDSV